MNLFFDISENQWDFSLTNFDTVWGSLIQISIVLVALLIGNGLRSKIKFLKKSLIPSALIGGLVLLLVNILIKELTGNELVNKQFMQILTYHGLGIGFVAMTLKTNKAKKEGIGKIVENGAMTGATYMLQAIFGLAVTFIIYSLTKESTNPLYWNSGLLLPLSFGQGPGNALTWDINFTNLKLISENGFNLFTGNGSFGLSLASIGFIVASVVGVIYINIFKKKGHIVKQNATEIKKDITYFEEENEIADSESIDKFSIQIGLVLLGYLLGFGIMFILAKISNFTNQLAWGFNFIWGVISANLIKLSIKGLKKAKIVTQQPINNYQMDRISGFAFDLMIVAGVAAIEIHDISNYVLPIIILSVVGTIITIIYIRFITKRRFSEYQHEMFVCNFGTLTGTASNGMILLKEIDPNLKTPTSNLFITSQLPATIFVAPLLLLLPFSTKSFNHSLIALGIFIILFIVYNIIIFRDKIFKKRIK